VQAFIKDDSSVKFMLEKLAEVRIKCSACCRALLWHHRAHFYYFCTIALKVNGVAAASRDMRARRRIV
jgi:hypothetical protein